jgi:hypothetical protein
MTIEKKIEVIYSFVSELQMNSFVFSSTLAYNNLESFFDKK